MESSVLGDVRVSRKAHLPPVQVGNACVKEGNTHVNGEGIQRLGGDPNRAENQSRTGTVSDFTALARKRARNALRNASRVIARGTRRHKPRVVTGCRLVFIFNYTDCTCGRLRGPTDVSAYPRNREGSRQRGLRETPGRRKILYLSPPNRDHPRAATREKFPALLQPGLELC